MATTVIYFLSFVAKEEWSREGQGSDADVVTRSGGDADLDVSQPEMESGEIRVEINMNVDPLYNSTSEQHPHSKSLLADSILCLVSIFLLLIYHIFK